MINKLKKLMIMAALPLLICGCTDLPQSLPPFGEAVGDNTKDYGGQGNGDASNWQQGLLPYSGEEYVYINGNVPFFKEEEITTEVFEEYSDLDALGRCGTAYANICQELMPTQERGQISHVEPSGWHTVKYDTVVGKYLYNRCHLIGYQLAGENANEKNLITGTRYLNVEGMLPWENLVADYVEQENNHVLYRVTPLFQGENLVASGVLMEAYSVEDGGAGVCFNVYCYNVQPGIVIDYATGESALDEASQAQGEGLSGHSYVCNVNTMKFHEPSCSGVQSMKEENREYFTGKREDLVEKGYGPCSLCHP